ncbi:GyrI-like domain-containing protein [Flavobacteriaceae bacterium TP-CH-4]|uniref:GyrI-like domain-containing protein n=1 Tax=Pelagihabitans pacificus TaxID=2696054 RepID=A0A967E6Z6_9FLAO|nr:GyrI-like domain-containing protein [Pelagihabitans pacificus]NHF59704.1 GyrI-like domain-containing protein [Pelagihabitans pacificus]
MKVLKIVTVVIGVLLIVLIGLYAYYGGLTAISPEIKEVGGETLVYEQMTGDYGQSAEVSDRVYQKLLDDYQIETTKGFGVYYDNPQTTEKEILRADVGCILESDFEKIAVLKNDFEIRQYPEGSYLTAEFPYRGMPSILIGIMKVYPALHSYLEQNGYRVDSPGLEIWDLPNQKIIYRRELIKVES